MTTKKPANTDVETLTSKPSTVTLVSGTEVEVQRLKTIQTFALMKILTAGMAGSIGELLFSSDPDETEEEREGSFAIRLIGTMLLAIPEATEETIDFVKSMVSPADLIKTPTSRGDKEFNLARFDALYEELNNPELEDLISIVERVIEVESPNIRALGKRLAVLFKAKSLGDTAKQSASSKSASKS